jgi:hypothetical protein
LAILVDVTGSLVSDDSWKLAVVERQEHQEMKMNKINPTNGVQWNQKVTRVSHGGIVSEARGE